MKRMISMILAVAVILSLSASVVAFADDEPITLTLAGSVTDDHPISQALYKFEELCEEYSDGRIEVDVYTNCQLGSNREMYEQCQAGNIQMAEAGAVILANFTDKFKFMQMPFAFNSREAVQNFLASDVGQQMNQDIAEETGFLPMVYFENGWQAITNSDHPVTTPEDLAGLKIRTQENDILLKIYTDMGCSPMPMAFTELFTAMQQGTIDGQVNPALIAQTGRYYEVQKYITDLNAIYDLDAISINYDFYQSLPEDLQEAVTKAINEARDYNLQLSATGEEDAYAFLEEQGMEITHLTDDERAAFQDLTAGVLDWFKDQGVEPKLDEYMAKIDECNQKYADGLLEDVTGHDK